MGRCKERREDGSGLGLGRRSRAVWMEQKVLRAAVTPGPAALGMLSPRRPGQHGCESMCMKPVDPSQILESAAMEGL